jgi:hypothetical protein
MKASSTNICLKPIVITTSARLVASFVLLLIGTALQSTAETNNLSPIQEWNLSHPFPTGQSLISVAHGPAGFVAVGTPRELLRSPDGMAWNRSTSLVDSTVPFGTVSFWNGHFVMAGGADFYFRSTNGVAWERIITPSETWPSLFMESETVSAIFGKTGKIIVSSESGDRVIDSGLSDIISVTYGNGKWLALPSFGSLVYTSTDLQTWAAQEFFFPVQRA